MYTSSAESLSLLRAMPRRNTRGLCSQGISDPTELAECFNDYFTNVGPDIAKTIDNSDINFTDYITRATSNFKFQAAVSESKVYRLLLSLNPCKSTDKIPKFTTN
jgi:hypothetical protein